MTTEVELPVGWSRMSLEDVAEIHDNLREPVNSSERSKRHGPYPYYGATGQVGWIDDYRQDGEYILLGEDGAPFFDWSKEKAYLVSGKCWVNNHAHVLKGKGGFCLNRYLLYALNQTDYRGYANGTTRLKLTQSAMKQIPINLAPLNEQHRIVAKIEELFSELDKGIENLKTAREQLKVYRQALLKHAFEGKLTAQWRAANPDKLEPAADLLARIQTEREQRYRQQLQQWEANGGSKPKAPKPLPPLTVAELAELPELPEGWGWVRISDIIADSTLGLDRGAQYQNPKPPGLPYIKMNNVTMDGRVTADKLVYVDVSESEQERYVLREGDILFNTRNSRELVGKTGLVRKFLGPTVYNNNLMRIRLHDGISPYFVCHQMCSAGFKRKLEEAKKGTTNVAAVYAKDLFPLLLVLAPQLEQQRIVELVEARLSDIDQLDQTIAASLQQSEALRQSILKRAFSGQLVAQDANDEPASVLLARIQAERTVQSVMAKPRKPKQVAADPAPEKSNTIPFPVRIPNISATDLHAGILARAYQHHENAPKYLGNFGHVKAEKIAHMVEAYLGIDLEREPIKDAAGPNDYPHLMKVESRARKANWFDVKKKKDADAYAFSKKHGFDALLLKTMKALGERAEEVDALISLLLPLNSRQSEIVATLYAAWNNLLLQGQTPDDEAIVQEARENWHASKLKIERDKFFRGLRWMREHGLVPAGRGRFVAKKS